MEVIPSSSRLLFLLIFSLCSLLLAGAHSFVSEPLTYLEFVTNPSIEILPRNRPDYLSSPIIDIEDDSSLKHDDFLRIQFIAFNHTFSIHLEPHLDLFHPEATVTIHHSDNSKTTTRLRPEDHRLYKGVLLDIDSTDNRLNEDIVGLKRMSLSEELSHSSGVIGWARIQIYDDGGVTQFRKNNQHPTFEGTFSLGNELYHIKSIKKFKLTQFKDDPEIPNPSARNHVHRSATMVIYRDSDIKKAFRNKRSPTSEDYAGSCAMDDIVSVKDRLSKRINNDQYFGHLNPWWNSLRIGDADKLTKRDFTPGCPTARKIAYMGAAADCTYVTSYKSPDDARKQILQDWGTASAVYETTFNVTLGLIKIDILDQNCPTDVDPNFPFNRQCDETYTINDRLSDFSQWRGNFSDDGASLWHLMSKCSTGTKVGVAWLGQLCQSKATYQAQDQAWVSGTGVSTIVKDEWKVVAHEVGHGFGAIHDCTSDNCPCNNCGCCQLSSTVCDAGGQYLMNPKSDVVTDQFSPCSITDICHSFPTIGGCLGDPGDKTILSESMCGNGLKEDNEECDCGTDCDTDPCCDGKTCKLINNAVCDDKNDMCCKNCQYKPANEVCRPASSNCDIPEICNGTSGSCPPDRHVDDGTTCAPDLQCAGGQCTSRDNQCFMRGGRLMGITKACPSTPLESSCVLSCANPNDTNSCIQMSGNFVDGTPCGIVGRCSKGQCVTNGNAFENFLIWYKQHPAISIPVTLILGLLLLCCVVQCVYHCRKKRTSKVRVNSSPPDSMYTRPNDYNDNYNYGRNRSKWVDPTPYNGHTESAEHNNERSVAPMYMPSPTHPKQRSRSPDFMYAGTSPGIHPESSQRPNVFDRSPVSPHSMNSSIAPRSPNSPHSPHSPHSPNRSNPNSPNSSNSSRRHFVDETFYNGPRVHNNYSTNNNNNYPMNNDSQYPYRRQ